MRTGRGPVRRHRFGAGAVLASAESRCPREASCIALERTQRGRCRRGLCRLEARLPPKRGDGVPPRLRFRRKRPGRPASPGGRRPAVIAGTASVWADVSATGSPSDGPSARHSHRAELRRRRAEECRCRVELNQGGMRAAQQHQRESCASWPLPRSAAVSPFSASIVSESDLAVGDVEHVAEPYVAAEGIAGERVGGPADVPQLHGGPPRLEALRSHEPDEPAAPQPRRPTSRRPHRAGAGRCPPGPCRRCGRTLRQVLEGGREAVRGAAVCIIARPLSSGIPASGPRCTSSSA